MRIQEKPVVKGGDLGAGCLGLSPGFASPYDFGQVASLLGVFPCL